MESPIGDLLGEPEDMDMTKAKVRTYNIIAFIILPVIIILIGVILCVYCQKAFMAPTVDFDKVTSQTQKAELWEVLTVEEGEDAYIIYGINDYYDLGEDDNELIAFRGTSIEEMRDIIFDCNHGAYATSYWEGEGKKFDFTTTDDFKQYLDDIKNTSYYNEAPNPDIITADFSNVVLYDLSEYKGYEHGYNNGIGIALAFVYMAIGSVVIVVLLAELVIAVILKLTVFKVKKEQQV